MTSAKQIILILAIAATAAAASQDRTATQPPSPTPQESRIADLEKQIIQERSRTQVRAAQAALAEANSAQVQAQARLEQAVNRLKADLGCKDSEGIDGASLTCAKPPANYSSNPAAAKP